MGNEKRMRLLRMKKVRSGIVLSSFSFMMVIFLVIGNVSSGKGPKIYSSPPCRLTEKLTKLTLFLNLSTPSNRSPAWPVPTFNPSMWSGDQSAFNTSQNSSMYYCLVTVKDLDCIGYGTNGVKSYRWNSQTRNNEMEIMVPEFNSFMITVEYIDPCNPAWGLQSNPSWGRGKWKGTKGPSFFSPTIQLTTWQFIEKINC